MLWNAQLDMAVTACGYVSNISLFLRVYWFVEEEVGGGGLGLSERNIPFPVSATLCSSTHGDAIPSLPTRPPPRNTTLWLPRASEL